MLTRSLLSPALQALALAGSTLALAPFVSLDYGAFQGFDSATGTESFLGVPFAQPP